MNTDERPYFLKIKSREHSLQMLYKLEYKLEYAQENYSFHPFTIFQDLLPFKISEIFRNFFTQKMAKNYNVNFWQETI